MKNQKSTKHTGVFQSMIENYRKNTSNILNQRKLAKSLNNYILKDINKVKIKDNFSDEDYFINEIKLENKLKSNINLSQNINEKVPDIINNSSNDKINKDIFFYYKYEINGRNKNGINNKKKLKKELKSLKSHKTIDSAKKSYSSYRKNSLETIILPLINSNNGNNKSPYQPRFNTIEKEDEPDKKTKSRNYERIKYSSKRRVENYLSYEKESFNHINKKNLLNIIKNYPHNHILKLHLPLVTNNIFSKINEVSDISKNISRNINFLSNEEKINIENERNRIRFMDNLMT